MVSTRPKTVLTSLPDLAKMIDHSLLHPTMTDDDVSAGLAISRKYSVATACVKPYHILFAKKLLEGSSVLVCPVIGFPHGNSTTECKMYEASRAVEEGGKEIDMVVNVGRVLSGKWEYVKGEIEKVNKAVTERGAILKVIFENDCEFQLLSEWRKEEKLMRIRSGREGDHQAL
jgi:deoxyribose-phosphate aldolase